MGGGNVPAAYYPGRDELGVGVDTQPRPNVAITQGAAQFSRHVIALAVAETPELIGLDPLTGQVNQMGIQISCSRGTHIHQEFIDRVNGDAGDPGDRPQAHALDHEIDDKTALFKRECSHNCPLKYD